MNGSIVLIVALTVAPGIVYVLAAIGFAQAGELHGAAAWFVLVSGVLLVVGYIALYWWINMLWDTAE